MIEETEPIEEILEKFDYCISNPPYQESVNGNNIQIWPNFIEKGVSITKNSCFITPGRWVNPKQNMIKTQEQLINNGLIKFTYITDEIFHGIAVDGGLSITVFKSNKKPEHILWEKSLNTKYKEWNPNDKFFLNNIEERIYNKVEKSLENNMDKYRVGNLGSLGSVFYGLHKNNFKEVLTHDKNCLKEPVKVWANNNLNGKSSRYDWWFLEKDNLVIDNDLLLNNKVMISKIGHADTNKTKNNIYNNVPVVLCGNEIGLGSVFYLVPENNTFEDCELIKSYMMTRFVRMLMNISQKDLYVRGLDNVPDYVLLKDALYSDGFSIFTDEWLFDYFGFDDELISYVYNRVSVK